MPKRKIKKQKNKETQKLTSIQEMITSAEADLKTAKELLLEILGKEAKRVGLKKEAKKLKVLEEGKIIEGIFDGRNMIGPDDRIYPIPANYASKSKLVEGDVLKLTIVPDGSFIFKQIGPCDRKKLIGKVVKESEGNYKVLASGKSYKVLLASVTYFKAEEGDEVTIVVPKEKESTWAAIENLIKKTKESVLSSAEAEEELEEIG